MRPVNRKGARESSIVRSILKALNAIPGVKAMKNHGGIYSVRGTPDITAVNRGKAIFLEVKRPGEKATPAQIRQMELWTQAGARCAVVHSADEAVALV